MSEEDVFPAEPTPEEPFEPPATSSKHEYSRSGEKRSRLQINPNASVAESSLYLTALPSIPEAPGEYQPYLYTFRVLPKKQTSKLKHMKAKTPPFYLLLDHTIAVVWTLFNERTQKDSLGIDQMQWAKSFLESIRDSRGFNPPGVALALNVLRDWLIMKYAAMSEIIPAYEPTNAGDHTKCELSGEEQKSFSFNYSTMIDKCPEPKAVEKRTTDECYVDAAIKAELEELKQLYGVDADENLCEKETVEDIMGSWRIEQIETIQKAVKTLHHISDIKKTLVNEGAEQNEDLMGKLDQLIADIDKGLI